MSKIPKYRDLEIFKCKNVGRVLSYASSLHPNPFAWKFHWWVFNRNSTVDGLEFLEMKHSLCTSDYVRLMSELESRGEFCLLYNRSMPRRDAKRSPFDPDSPYWNAETEWAPAYDDDSDPAIEIDKIRFK